MSSVLFTGGYGHETQSVDERHGSTETTGSLEFTKLNLIIIWINNYIIYQLDYIKYVVTSHMH